MCTVRLASFYRVSNFIQVLLTWEPNVCSVLRTIQQMILWVSVVFWLSPAGTTAACMFISTCGISVGAGQRWGSFDISVLIRLSKVGSWCSLSSCVFWRAGWIWTSVKLLFFPHWNFDARRDINTTHEAMWQASPHRTCKYEDITCECLNHNVYIYIVASGDLSKNIIHEWLYSVDRFTECSCNLMALFSCNGLRLPFFCLLIT